MARFRDSNKADVESEPSNAKGTAKDLASWFDESNVNVEARVRDEEIIKKRGSGRDDRKDDDDDDRQYAEVMRQLESVRQELSKLKLDVAAVLEEKTRAEKEVEASSSKSRSTYRSLDDMRREMDEINEEQVLVELAKIEALKEKEEIEARKEKEAGEFMSKMEEKRKKMKEVVEEIDSSKELESKLALTLLDVNVLHNELKLAREMERKVQRNHSSRSLGGSFGRREESEGSPSLRSITEELEAAKKELASIKEEGFQFMASMDVIRSELKHVSDETALLKKQEAKADITVQNLNSKLLRAKPKLEAATLSEEKAKSIVSNLSLTLEQLKTEAEVARKEKALIAEETESIKAEIQKNESEIELAEERLEAAMLELEATKSSEAIALSTLKKLTENAMRARASSQHRSTINISKFEHEYLTGRAVSAEELADKKVAASQAWIEALKASEKEMLLKLEIARRDIREVKAEEEREVRRARTSLSAKRAVEGELRNCRRKPTRDGESKRSRSAKGILAPPKRSKQKSSVSPAATARTTPRTTPINLRKKKKAVPNIVRLLSGKKIDKNQ